MNQAEAPTHILTIEEVAETLRCSKAHVSKALSGKIPGVPRLTHFAVGRRKLVRREWLDEWLEANKKR
jgi:excisionase family DNA binding protein